MNNKITIRQTIILFALTLLVFHPFFTAVEAYASTDKNEIEDLETTTSENDSINEEEEHTLLIEEELDEEELLALCKENEELEEIIMTSEDSEEPIIVECASLEDELENDEKEEETEVENEDPIENDSDIKDTDIDESNEDDEKQDNSDLNNDVNEVEKENNKDTNTPVSEDTSKEKVENNKEDKQLEKKTTVAKQSVTKATTKNTVLKKGVRHAKVKTLKSNLKKLGFTVPGNGTNLFGVQTEAKVKDFQKYYGLKVTGIANDATLKKIDAVLKSPLQKGKRNNDVKKLKADLKKIGYPVPGNGTNLFGVDTEKVVKKFQKEQKLVVNGIADEVTLKKIAELVKKVDPDVLENGVRHAKVKTLKANLKKLGFTVPGNGTNLFGIQTEAKVKEFQKYYGLSVTGKVNKTTENKIQSILKSPLQKGKRNNDVKKLKADLKKIGYPVPGNGTNLFGVETEKVIKKFQKEQKLVVNGIADEITLKKIAELVKKAGPDILENGVRHERVKTLKANLKKLGFTVPGSGTTLYGAQTEKKVKEFQKYYGLSVTGKVNNKTEDKIQSILKSPLQKGKSSTKIATIKKQLNKIGYGGITVTNYFGDFMEKRVKEFQKDNGLPVSGIIDPKTEKAINNYNLIKIFIDPGHGGSDPGASGNGLREKDLTLQIAKAIRKHLEATYKNIEIMMSRTTDKYLSLQERTDMANKWGADYFISVHINSFTQASANGFETFIHNGKGATAEDKRIQNIVHDSVAQNIPSADRGKKEANFHVLRESNMPSMLLEYLFITNKNDAANLKKSSFIDKLGKLTAQGLGTALKLAKK